MKSQDKATQKPRQEQFNQWLQIFALVFMIWFIAFMAISSSALAAGPLVTYETAVPGEAPSWLVVYEDGRIERDLAPYMKQAGRQVGQLDPVQMGKVTNLVRAVLNLDEAQPVEAAHSHADEDMGMVSLSVSLGGKHRSLQWRPVPGQGFKPQTMDGIDSVLTSLLYEAI